MNRLTLLFLPLLLLNPVAAFSQVILPTPSHIAYLLPEGQLNVRLDNSADLRTAREKILDQEFSMPRFGLKESVAVLGQRLNYAEKLGWLSQFARNGIDRQYEQILDRSEQSALGSNVPDFRLATDVYKLNQAFVHATVLDEQENPGREGIATRGSLH